MARLAASVQVAVEVACGCVQVWDYPKHADAERKKYRQKPPADKAALQAEEFPALAVHHLLAAPDRLAGTDLRILSDDKEDHRI